MKNKSSNLPLELNDELINYYDDLIKKIKDDFNNKKYKEAIARCEEELEQPYLPFEYIKEFEQLLFQMQAEYRYLQLDDKLKNQSKQQMINSIFDNVNFNVYLFDFFIEKYHSQLEDIDYNIIQKWLMSKKLDNSQKFYLLDTLAAFKIDRNFIFYNSNIDDDIVLNTLTFHENEYFKPYNLSLEIIEQDLFKDPIVSKFAIDLLDAVSCHYFPTFPFSSAERLAEIIMSIIHSSMNFKELKYDSLLDDEKKVFKIFIEIQNLDS